MAKKLTKSDIESISVPQPGNDGRTRYSLTFEEVTPGFGVRTTSTGVKSFIWQSRVNGQKQRHTIGRFGVITVEQARKVAQQLAGEVASGKDPRSEKHRRRSAAVSLHEAFEGYLASRTLKATTLRDIDLVKAQLADWMSKPVTRISRDMVANRHRRLGNSSEAGANRCMRYLRAVLNFASEAYAFPDGRPLLVDNPVTRLSATRSWYRIKPRRTYLAPHELSRWMTAVDGLADVPDRPPGLGKSFPKLRNGEIARDFLMLVLLTGLRRNEALNLRWRDVDLEGRLLTIPEPKNDQAHILPLSDYLVAMLGRRKGVSASEFVFADSAGTRFTNFRYALERIETLSGLRATCHDLRRTFATVAESLDIPAYAVKGLLNHKTSGDVTAGYIQITPERLRQPMQRITNYFLGMSGLRRPANIVTLSPSRSSSFGD